MKRIRLKGPTNIDLPLKWDCPWMGHLYDESFVLRNSSNPNVLGRRCVKCGCLIYLILEQSQIVGADGNPLAKA